MANKLIWCLFDNSHTCQHRECCQFCKENRKCTTKCLDYTKGLCKFLIEKENGDNE